MILVQFDELEEFEQFPSFFIQNGTCKIFQGEVTLQCAGESVHLQGVIYHSKYACLKTSMQGMTLGLIWELRRLVHERRLYHGAGGLYLIGWFAASSFVMTGMDGGVGLSIARSVGIIKIGS